MKIASVFLVIVALIAAVTPARAHEWHRHQHEPDPATGQLDTGGSQILAKLAEPMTFLSGILLMQVDPQEADIAQYFNQFENVKARWIGGRLRIESNGLPNHNMMVGITNWQQQVPLPQPFQGDNAWSLPLNPKLAERPISVREKPLRGAIAIAVNGVPIFCALNNRGEDANLLGELDQWGGHCGRGDDYHYHIAPVHLEEVVGKGNPIAFALDGFPIYGYTEADGSPVGKLDAYNGQFDAKGNYHYHATEEFPYINGGLRGEVTMQGDQVEQPRDNPIRPGQAPLRGAEITDFKTTDRTSVLTYEVRGRSGSITYTAVDASSWKFTYVEPGGRTSSETYQRRAGRPPRGDRRPPPPRR